MGNEHRAVPRAGFEADGRWGAPVLDSAENRSIVAALDARRAALERYADVLERGLVEDLELAIALRAQREAEGGIDTLLGRLQAIRQPENTSPR